MPTASALGAALTAVNPSRLVGFGFNVSATALKNRARQLGGNAAAPRWTRALCSAVRANGSWAIADHERARAFCGPGKENSVSTVYRILTPLGTATTRGRYSGPMGHTPFC
jgi:hypothetical protein